MLEIRDVCKDSHSVHDVRPKPDQRHEVDDEEQQSPQNVATT